MKLLKFIPVLAGMLILGNFASCKKDEPADPAHFGKWKASVITYKLYASNALAFDTTVNYDDTYTEIIHFKDEKNVSFSYTDNIVNESSVDNATYKIEGNMLIVTYESNYNDTLENFKVDGSKLKFEFYDPSKTDPDREEYYMTYNKMN